MAAVKRLWTPREDVRVPDLSKYSSLIESAQVPGAVDGVNIQKLYEYPFMLTVDNPNQAISVAANSSSPILQMRVSPEAPMEIIAQSLSNTGAALVMMQIMDGITPRALMNDYVHVGAIFGSNTLPYRLIESVYIDEGRSLDIRFTDLTGSTNALRPILHGARYSTPRFDPRLVEIRKRLAEKQFLSMPFFYTTSNGRIVLTGSGTSQQVINIGPDHHFELHKISASATSMLFNINVLNGTTGKSIIDGPAQANFRVSASLIVGSNTYPFVLPEPMFFEAGSTIVLDLEDYSTSSNTVYLALHGRIISKQMWR